ncbi:DUF2512 family protein [Evansella sp. AB-P1]|uniref:DUF2512 family protein n=1 Tax=Evansella sp. AB-P1 TaxID=3037653 RepID=UPI00241EB9BF|nr:DUF2512 family protein [Evansella sp. AB-P1]MDG5789644.1 DUF2512 family protein [Evansella sp. AB-P1]
MKHVSAIVVKVLMVALVLLIVLTGVNNYPFIGTIILSLLIVGLSYIVGDMGILRISNNLVATIADLGLTTASIWLLSPFIYGIGVPFSLAFISSLVISVGEWFFHKFVGSTILYENDPSPQT